LKIPTNIHDKFVIYNRSYSVCVKSIEEIELLKEYLDFDFIAFEEEKFPPHIDLIALHCEFVVTSPQAGTVVTYFSEKNGHSIPFWHNFEDLKKQALDLETFRNPKQNLKELWKYHAKNNPR